MNPNEISPPPKDNSINPQLARWLHLVWTRLQTLSDISSVSVTTGTLYAGNVSSGSVSTGIVYATGVSTGYVSSGTLKATTNVSSATVSTSRVYASNVSTATVSTATVYASTVSASGEVTGSNLSGTNTGDQTISLTGDVTGSGTGSFTATLSTTISAAGPIGSATIIPIITYDAKGRLTAVSSVAASGVSSHAGLSGLTADDHPQYMLSTGARAATAVSTGTLHVTSNASSATVSTGRVFASNASTATVSTTNVYASGNASSATVSTGTVFAPTVSTSGVSTTTIDVFNGIDMSILIDGRTETVGAYKSRVYANELTMTSSGVLVIPATSNVLVVG